MDIAWQERESVERRMNLEFANLVKVTTVLMAVIGLRALIVWALENKDINEVAETILMVIMMAFLLGIVGVIVWAWCTW